MIDQTISHYKILEKIGEGSMGDVYKAEDTKLKRNVALKFLSRELTCDEEAKNNFIHEARTASALDHPNICTIHEINETKDGQLFIVMTWYDGDTLKKKTKNRTLNEYDIIDIAIQIASGLQVAHLNCIIHRDIKPGNILF